MKNYKPFTKSKSLSCALIVVCGIMLNARMCYSQVSDATHPILLSNNVVAGSEEPKGQSRFYAFSAGPGDVTVKIDGATDFYSTVLKVVVRDSRSHELANVSFPANSDTSTKTATFRLQSKENLTMQLMSAVDVGVHLQYKVSLEGANSNQSNSMIASGEKTTAPPTSEVRTTEDIRKETLTSHSQEQTQSATQSSTQASSSNKPIDDKWAVIIGISKFQKPEIALKYPAKDARDLRDYLVNEANFAPDHVKLLVDEQATKTNVLAEIGDKWLPHLVRPNDLVLIFISSHGSPSSVDMEGLNYLVMHDTDPNSLYATGLPLQDLAAAIKQRVHANRVVLVVDACHSGAANPAKGLVRVGNFDSQSLALGTGQLVICSSEPSQVSWESKRYSNGVFTHQLIEALRSKNGKITLGQAFDQMKESVISEVLKDRGEMQSPVIKSQWSGNDLILSTPPAHPHAVPVEYKNQ